MSTHPDAIGYLTDLSAEINEPWFKMICDIAIVDSVSVLNQATRDTLFALYTERASYLGNRLATVAPTASVSTISTDFVEQLSGFTNYKRLEDALEVTFQKRITLIFGANGSGKSSLCEALKVLSTTEPPIRPLENVRLASVASPSFHYKFNSDTSRQTWTHATGYGPRQSTIKYFDNAIAIRSVKNAVDPGRIIVLEPFKLHVFERAKELTTMFREVLQKAQRDNSEKLLQALETIRTDFSKFAGRSLAVIEDKTVAGLQIQIKLGEEFVGQKLLSEKQAVITELEKAASEEGLRLLRAEHRELESFLTSINTLLTSACELWALEPASKAKMLVVKQTTQEVLAKALIPKDGTLEGFLALLRDATPLCKMGKAAGHACPLCKRDLGAPEVELFKQYHDLLAGELEKDIIALKVDLTKSREFAIAVENVDRKAWDKYTTIQAEVLRAAKTGADLIVANCDISKEPTAEAKVALELLNATVITWSTQLESMKNAIEVAAKGRDELMKLRIEIEPMEYAQAISERLEKLREVQRMGEEAAFWGDKLPAFIQVLKKITEKAKDAHEALVVVDFEARLDAEYKALAEKDMAAFGVRLAPKGADATVTVLPQIGGQDIECVLSEGEQRVHALALFFAELETCSQSVLVFDDPVSSFDYNYIANYCARLRDFVRKHPSRQIIILTHNWEFFVQLQTTLNQASLDSLLSVQILENCVVVADYSEKVDDLKKDIEAVFVAVGEPSKAKKGEIAGKMRRLIEAVINTYVFNNERHQYKQKSQCATVFQKFTKIVALSTEEATTLHDLYRKLSISEHDDPRNAYVNTDKAMFQTRYNQILAVESAIKARVP